MSNGEIWENLSDEVSADGDGNDDDVADDSDVDDDDDDDDDDDVPPQNFLILYRFKARSIDQEFVYNDVCLQACDIDRSHRFVYALASVFCVIMVVFVHRHSVVQRAIT